MFATEDEVSHGVSLVLWGLDGQCFFFFFVCHQLDGPGLDEPR